MKLAMRQIEEERLEGCLNPADPLAEAIYSLYRSSRPTTPVRRVVVLTGERDWDQLDASRRAVSTELDADAACHLLWSTLRAGDQRIGDVIYGGRPQDQDYVIHRQGDGYRVAMALGAGERLLGAA
jgi:hypothetical protein